MNEPEKIEIAWGKQTKILLVQPSKLDKIADDAFSQAPVDELSKYRDRLYTSLSDADKLTWTKLVVFLSSFALFYLIASNRINDVSLFGAKINDASFLRQVYPFYIFYSFYQFVYAYAWGGVIQYQLERINRHTLDSIARDHLHFFTFPTNPHLFRNFTARHLGQGVVSRDMLMSTAAFALRILLLGGITAYVYRANIRDFGLRSAWNILSALFGIAVLFRVQGILTTYKTLVYRGLSEAESKQNEQKSEERASSDCAT
jgi:hypothetical protein